MSPTTTSKYTLVGYPLTDSISLYVHQKLFELSNKNSIYDLYAISQQNFKESIEELMAHDGFNVTVPYKNAIIPHLDQLDEKASLYQEVNTVNCGDQNIGYNTESFGFLKALQRIGVTLNHSEVLLLGVGEYAKMAAIETVLTGSKLTIATRPQNIQYAELLREMLMNINASAHIRVIDTMQAQAHHDLLINASPIGLSPHISECPVPDKAIERVDAVFDFICNPVQTRLLKLAEENGKPCSNGIPMLVWQAVGAHRIWYDAQFADEDIEELIENTEAMAASGFTQDSSERACQI